MSRRILSQGGRRCGNLSPHRVVVGTHRGVSCIGGIWPCAQSAPGRCTPRGTSADSLATLA
eukprot:8649050-Prorocentrum_lima.AAC.1